MKTIRIFASLVMLCAFLSLASSAFAGEEGKITVPKTLEDISDIELREAIRGQVSFYNDLGRGSQVFTFVNTYRYLNNGRIPALVPEDAALLEPKSAAPAEVHNLEVPVQHANTPAPGQTY